MSDVTDITSRTIYWCAHCDVKEPHTHPPISKSEIDDLRAQLGMAIWKFNIAIEGLKISNNERDTAIADARALAEYASVASLVDDVDFPAQKMERIDALIKKYQDGTK